MTNKNLDKDKKRNKSIIAIVLMLLLLATLFIVQCHLGNIKQEAFEKERELAIEAMRKNSLDSLKALEKLRADSLLNDSLKRVNDSIKIADSLKALDEVKTTKKSINFDSIRNIRDSINRVKDSLKQIADSLAILEQIKNDSLENIRKQDSIRALDKTPPVAEITPPAGRYYNPIKVKVRCDEIKCKTYISIGDTLHPTEALKATEYNKTGSVFYYATDSVGNRTEWEEAKYDMASDNICGKNAYPVPVNGKTICVDAYEYPNKADEIPKDMVSQEEATNICAQEGKHLCSFAEWQAACKSKDNTRYSYGDSYKQNKCNTNTKAAKRSGRKEQCRSWYGMYDMNGNLWEWTSTKNKDHPNMYLVAGGAWNTNNESKCTDSKFSFYPQNQYPSVGFRCCK